MRTPLVLALAALLSLPSQAQPPRDQPEHAAHHPGGASAPGKAPAKRPAARPKAAAAASAPASGAGMRPMHGEVPKPGGMHEAMHGQGGAMQRGPMAGMPPAPAASPASR